MRCHGDYPQVRTGEHHHCVVFRNTTAFGDKLCLPGMRKANGVKLRFGNWASYQRRRAASSGKTDCHFQRLVGAMRSIEVWGTGDDG